MSKDGNGPAAVAAAPVVEVTARKVMDDLRAVEAYQLDGEDWASDCARKVAALVGAYLDDEPLPMWPLDAPGALVDPLENYVRDCAAVSPAVSLELMLPAGYAYAGALGGGGVWVAWNGRGTWQVAPCTVQAIGLAPSGVGKSTQQKLLNLAYSPAAALAEDAIKKEVSDWAAACGPLINEALAADADAATAAGPASEDFLELGRAKKALRKLVSSIDLEISTGVKMVYSDATAEALVASAISFGGAAFIRSAEQDMLDNLTRYSAGGSGASLTLFTDGWDGAAYARDRRGSGYAATSALVVSMSLMTQTESFMKSFGVSGDAWLGKGLLGRAWLSKGAEAPLEDLVAADLARRQAGVVPVPVSASLSDGLERLALAGAGARAVRLLEDRLASVAVAAGPDASVFLKKGLAACRGGVGGAVTLESIASGGGVAGGLSGRVVGVGASDAGRLEDLHSWLLRCYGAVGRDDPVLGAVITRLTYHVCRLAGLRSLLVPEGVGGVLADTACRLVPWLLSLHLAALGGLVSGFRMEAVRQDLVASRGSDSSMGGRLVDALRKAGVVEGSGFPMPVSKVVELASRGHRNAREYREGVREYFKREYERQMNGEPGDGYFVMKPGRKAGSVVVDGFGPMVGVSVTPAGMVGLTAG